MRGFCHGRGLYPLVPGAVAGVVLALAGALMAADEEGVKGVHQLLDRIEKAHATHDLKLLDEQCTDKYMLGIVVGGPPAGRKAFVLDRDRLLGAVGEQSWKQGLLSRRKTDRDIAAGGSVAWFRATTVDQYKNGAMAEFRDLYAAYRRDGTWRVCFAMPDLFRPAYVIVQGDAGLDTGDVVTAFGEHKMETLAGGQAAMQQFAARKEGDPAVMLTVLRKGREVRVALPPRSATARVEPRMVPTGAARLLGNDEPHPVRDFLQQGIEIARKAQADDFAKDLHPAGFLGIYTLPGGEGAVVNRLEAIAKFRDSMLASHKTIDWDKTTLSDCRVITDGNVALGAGVVTLALRNGTQHTMPTRVQVFTRQGERWFVTANLGQRVRFGLDCP